MTAARILSLALLGVALAPPMLAADVGDQPTDAELLAMVQQLLREVPLIDGHNDLPWTIRERYGGRIQDLDLRDTKALEPAAATDLSRLHAGGVGAVFWSVWVPTELAPDEAVRTVLEQVDLVHRMTSAYPDDLEIALTAADVRRIHSEGRIASLIGAEGGHSIADSPAILRILYATGVRYLTLTHWSGTDWADSATAKPEHEGLTGFGKAVVREMNRLGMLVDLSHVSVPSMHDALDTTRAPVILSHSCAAALNPHPRNVPDEVLRRLSDNGGVVMVNFGSFFVSPQVVERVAAGKAEAARLEVMYPGDPEAAASSLERWYDDHPMPKVSLAEVADHIDHIRRVAGIDHIGLGSDYDGLASLPDGLEDVSCYPALLVELARRGYSRDDLAKVAGLNVLRVLADAERVAASLQGAEPPLESGPEVFAPASAASR